MKIVIDGDNPNTCYRCDYRSGNGCAECCSITGVDVTDYLQSIAPNCPIRPKGEVDSDEILDIILGGAT